jgi:hypothetical protein
MEAFLLTVIAGCKTIRGDDHNYSSLVPFLARVFAVGSFVIAFSVAGSLLGGELAKAWVAEIRRIVKRDAAENKSC